MLNQKIILTGGSGYIGRELLVCLRTRFSNIIVLDRPHLHSILSSLSESAASVPSYLYGAHCLFHLAGRAHKSGHAKSDWHLYVTDNIILTENVIRLANLIKVNHFIFASTISVLDVSLLSTLRSNENSSSRSSFYILSKLISESLVKSSLSPQSSYTIVRLPLVLAASPKGSLSFFVKLLQYGAPLPFASLNLNSRYIGHMDQLCVDLLNIALRPKLQSVITFLPSMKLASTREIFESIALYQKAPIFLFAFPSAVLIFFAKVTGIYGFVRNLFEDQLLE